MFGLSNSQSTIKTFVFEKQQTHQSELFQEEIDLRSPYVDLSKIFQAHASLDSFNISIYDPRTNQFRELDQSDTENGLVPKSFLEPSVVLVRYRKKQLQELDSESNQNSSKRGELLRSKERTIAEVIALVKHWRTLHQSGVKNSKGKKINLQEAARQVGISKKSLDDYYCQLRLAQLHNFNFADNMHQKMGKLRTYVKGHRIDEAARIRHHKHPKNLKIIEEFNIDQNMEQYIMQERQMASQRINEINVMNQENQIISQSPVLREPFEHKIFNIQNAFYEGFEFFMDEPSDPFLFQQNDFKKKPYESDSEGSLFL